MKCLLLIEESRAVDLVTKSGNLFVLLSYNKNSSPRHIVWKETNLLFDFVGDLGIDLLKCQFSLGAVYAFPIKPGPVKGLSFFVALAFKELKER